MTPSLLLSCEHLVGGGSCSNLETAPTTILPRNWRGPYKACACCCSNAIAERCGGSWSIWKRGVQRASGEAWNLQFSLNNPTSCMQVPRHLGTCLPKGNPSYPNINPWLQLVGHVDCVLVICCHLNYSCLFSKVTPPPLSFPQNVPVCRRLVHATGFSSTEDFGREILCKVGLIYGVVVYCFSVGLSVYSFILFFLAREWGRCVGCVS